MEFIWKRVFAYPRIKGPLGATELKSRGQKPMKRANILVTVFSLCITIDSSHLVHTMQLLFWDRMWQVHHESILQGEGSRSMPCRAL